MSVLVVVPTFRRPGPLRWSLASVLQQSAEPGARVVVVNNGGDDGEVDRAVASTLKVCSRAEWRVEVIHRRPAIDPVVSWFGALRERGRDGDIALIHGDDDILLPESVGVRARALRSAGADILICRGAGNIVFWDDAASRASLDVGVPLVSATAAPPRRPGARELAQYECGFIGNATYTLGEGFWAIYQRALAALERQPLTQPSQRAMMPLVLAILCNDAGTLAVADIYSTLRGQLIEEIRRSRWGVANWQFGVLFAGVLSLLEDGLLHDGGEHAVWRARLRADFASWYLPTLLDSKGRRDLRALGMLDASMFRYRDWRDLAQGARRIAASVLGRRGHKLEAWSAAGDPRALFGAIPPGLKVPEEVDAGKGTTA